jgi:hypothetical protein
MSRFARPVFQEAVQIYLVEGKAWIAYAYFLALLAAVQLLTLLLPTLDPSSWMGSAQIFKVSCVVSLFSGVYFTLRLANQEYTPWRFAPLKRWLEQEGFSAYGLALAQLAVLGAYSILFVFLSLPFLTWAAAIARTGVYSLISALVVILGYFMVYGVWGLVTLNLWERRVETRHIVVRCLLGCFFILTALVYLPLNPFAFLLSFLGGGDLGNPVFVFGLRCSPKAIHILFHAALLACGVLLCQWLLARKAGADGS